ncbi:MAG: glycosyltransferase family 4 protein, partial [Pirellulales bacterium]|nr:glycosyltransferase family 4 protein [Pirellulales bacterium]
MNLALALFTHSPHSGLSRDAVAIARACEEGGHRVRVYAGEMRDGALRDSGLDAQLLAPPRRARGNARKNRDFAARLPGAVADFSPDLIIGFNKMPGLDVYYAADAAFAVK